MQTLLIDLGYAIRQLRKTPGLAVLAIITLALGVGANTAIFTVVESVLLRPLPYPHSDRLVYIAPGGSVGFANTSWLNYRDFQDQTQLMSAVAGYSEDLGVMEGQNGAEGVLAPRVTTNLLSMLEVHPMLGRGFTAADGQTGAAPVVLLSEGLWRESFHSDPGIAGKTVRLSGKSYNVAGVMPRTFLFPEHSGPEIAKAVWVPVQPSAEMLKDRGYHFFNIVGELRAGVTLSQAQHETDVIAERIAKSDPEGNYSFDVRSYQEVLTGPVKPVLYALFAALGLVLLIACANVSNLLIARCLGRQQEFAVRAALGASRLRLVRQLLAEGLVLSLFGCAVGIVFAEVAMLAVAKLPEGTIPRAESISIHWTVVLALGAIAVLTTVLSSLLPALLVAQANPQAALQAASRGIGSRSVSGKLSGWLVAGEVALSTLLLVGTGLLFHTLWNLQKSQLGFDVARVTEFTAEPSDSAGFSSMAVSEDAASAVPSVATQIYLPTLERMRQTPGVESAALASSPPLSGLNVDMSLKIVGQASDPKNKPSARISAVSGEYASTLGTPMVRGRMITDSDTATSPAVLVINQTLAKKYFAGQDPIGRQLDLGGKETGMLLPMTIVGVIGDQVDSGVGVAAQPLVLVSEQQVPTTSLFYQALLKTVVSFVVKTHGAIPVAAEMRTVFHDTAPGYAVDGFQSMQEAVDSNTFSQRLGLYLVGSFAGLAIAMVIAGLYGVLSQLVSYRRREIGVRMALGATRGSVAQLILRQGSILIGSGLVAGLVLSFGATRLIKGFLYEVPALDGWTYLAVAVTLLAIGLVAAYFPARRAASIQPMEALRTE